MTSQLKFSSSLLAEIAERRCALVLGSGASASSENLAGKRPPDWDSFLRDGMARISANSDRTAALELLDASNPLDAAQVLVDSLGPAEFAKFIRDAFAEPEFKASELHRTILEIDPKIIITTNYDRILEQVASDPGYNVCRYHDDHIVDDLRSTRRLILKVHGCVSDPQKVVLSRKQYFEAKRGYPGFFSALDSIFLHNTLLFIGSGFNGDPDIELLLQNTHISAPSAHPHYAIVEAGRNQSVRRAMEETYNIRFIEYDKGNHGQVISGLQELASDIQAYRSLPS